MTVFQRFTMPRRDTAPLTRSFDGPVPAID